MRVRHGRRQRTEGHGYANHDAQDGGGGRRRFCALLDGHSGDRVDTVDADVLGIRNAQRSPGIVTAVKAASVIPAVLLIGFVYAPVAQADPGGGQAALQRSFAEAGGPFIGSWGAHGEGVTVNADGAGVETSRRGTVNFKLGSVQTSTTPWDTAYGNVVSGFLERGAFVTLMLVDGGNGMAFSAGGGDNNFPFCKVVNGGYANSADCGA